MTLKRTMCALLAATMMVPTAVLAETAASAAEVDTQESAATVSVQPSYGLASNCQDGTILHCFDWKYNDIKAELANIAAAGFTSVQTSPAQPNGSGAWYWLYQPLSFSCGDNGLGTPAELESLCQAAEAVGVKVIVDVVANHLNGDHSRIQADLRDSQYWHTYGTVSSWSDRYQVTHGEIGMADLATENSYVQQCVKNYILELKGKGVDGIRWDAVKHIGLPSEGDNFLAVVTDTGLYNYGEILVGPDDRSSGNEGLMKEYTNYMSVTDNVYGNDHRNKFAGGQVYTAYGNWVARGLTSDKVVYWSESHDTWANAYEGDYSWNKSQNVVDRAYAAVAARNKASSLYFSRPFSDPSAKENTTVGAKGSTHFTAKEIAEVNKFHNAMVGLDDYYSASNGCAVITRKGGGAVIVKGSGSGQVSVENGGSYAKTGTYQDKISGNTFTVTATTISGTIGDSGIAVIYDGDVVTGGVSASPATGTSFTDTLTVTLNATDVTNPTYTTSEGASGSYTNGQTIVVGGSTAEGSTVTVNLSGTDKSGKAVSAKYTYTKKAPRVYPTLNGGGFVFDNSDKNWSTVKAYVYDESGSSVITNAGWPGSNMTDCGNGYWKYELDSKFSGSSNVQVIFNNGSEQIPVSQQPGFKMTSTDKKLYEGGSWKDLPVTSNLKVTLSAASSSVSVGDSVKLTASATGASGTVTYTFTEGSTTIASSTSNTCTWTPSAAGTATLKVTAKDSSGSASATTTVTVSASKVPTVTPDKASGSSFTTETMSLKLTLANATSGTYSVDDGPTKTFSGSKTITIGEGKIGDSTVTVKTTATDGSQTKTYTYTYEKKYVKKTSSSSTASGIQASAAAPTSPKFATNPNGQVGKNKTITKASDFTEDMIIAQGVANDDPAGFRGTHEAPKFDQYALYAAWDNTNLYVGIQYVNVIDVVDPAQQSPQTGRGKPNGADADIPQMLIFDTKSGNYTDGSTNSAKQPTVWNTNITFGGSTKVDKVIMYSPKDGINNYSVFPVTGGKIDYDNAISPGYQQPLPGASITWEDGFFCSHMYGINKSGNSYTPADLDSSSYTDFLTTGHSTDHDTFCIITMPLEYLGVSASQISSNGIGLMAVATYGESGIGCLPHDTCMLDNAKEPYVSDDSTSGEKSDADKITVPLASVGKSDGSIIVIDDPDDETPLQVNFGTNKSAPQLTSTALTLKGIGYGGTAPYQYQFSVDGTVVKAKNSTDTYTWTPGSEGSHTIKCVITDSTGATATVSKTFTAELDEDDPIPDLVNSSTVSATSVTKGDTITITGKASGGTSPYKYRFSYKRASQSSYTVKSDYGNAASVTLTPGYAETYTVKIDVKDNAGTVKTKTYTIDVSENVTTLVNNSTVSSTSVTQGTTITITGKASGGTGGYKYKFSYKRASQSSYTVKSDYGKAASVTLTPAYVETYTVKVDAKDSAGTVKTKTFTITVKQSTPLANNSTVSKTTANVGDTITISGKASGGAGGYKYAYYYKRDSMSTFLVKGTEYGTATSVTLTPSYNETYHVMVNVKDSAGTIVTKNFTISVGSTTPLANNSTVSSTSVTKGTAITITGKASGGTSPYKYKFSYKRASQSSYTVKSDYGKATSVTLTPAYVETYTVKVDAKDNTGTVKTKTFTITVKDSVAELVNNSMVSDTTITKGSTIGIVGMASGGVAPYQYKISYKKASASSYTVKSAYGAATYVEMAPGSAEKYTIKVEAKDSNGTVKAKTFTVTVNANSTSLVNNSTISTRTAKIGSAVKIIGSASGGSGSTKYEFSYRKGNAASYTTKSAYGNATSVTLSPASGDIYTVRVKAKDSKGTVVTKTFVLNSALTNTSTISSTSISKGTTIKIKGASTGGKGDVVYAFYYKKSGDSSFTTKSAYGKATAVDFTPSTATTYTVKVNAKDTNGTVVSKTFTVKVS